MVFFVIVLLPLPMLLHYWCNFFIWSKCVTYSSSSANLLRWQLETLVKSLSAIGFIVWVGLWGFLGISYVDGTCSNSRQPVFQSWLPIITQSTYIQSDVHISKVKILPASLDILRCLNSPEAPRSTSFISAHNPSCRLSVGVLRPTKKLHHKH